MRVARIVWVVVVLIAAIYLWRLIRLESFQKHATVTLPGGTRISARITEVKRVGPDAVQVRMAMEWPIRKGEVVVTPNMTLSRPNAALLPFPIDLEDLSQSLAADGVSKHTQCIATFKLASGASSIDIAQPVYVRRPESVMYAEFPLGRRPGRPEVRRLRTARIELMDWGDGPKYASGDWIVNTCNETRSDVPPDYLCFRVNQTNPPGPLADRSQWFRCGDDICSCEAELMDQHGKARPMTASYAARSDCEEISYKHHQSAARKVVDAVVRSISGGMVGVCTNRGFASMTGYKYGNGHWLYAFKRKPGVQNKKLRISYVLPPAKKDVVYIRFRNVPI